MGEWVSEWVGGCVGGMMKSIGREGEYRRARAQLSVRLKRGGQQVVVTPGHRWAAGQAGQGGLPGGARSSCPGPASAPRPGGAGGEAGILSSAAPSWPAVGSGEVWSSGIQCTDRLNTTNQARSQATAHSLSGLPPACLPLQQLTSRYSAHWKNWHQAALFMLASARSLSGTMSVSCLRTAVGGTPGAGRGMREGMVVALRGGARRGGPAMGILDSSEHTGRHVRIRKRPINTSAGSATQPHRCHT